MGKRGPAPMPTRLRVLRGETRPSQINRHEPEPRPGFPSPPSDLEPAASAVWEEVRIDFAHTGVIRAVDAPTLRMYCDAVARYAQHQRLFAQSGPLIRGQRTGELVKNPLHQIVRDEVQLVRALAGELGLTPAARSALRGAGEQAAVASSLQTLRERVRRVRSA